MDNFKTLLKRFKYNTRYLIKANVKIPSNFRILKRRNTQFQHFFLSECINTMDQDVKIDVNDKVQRFGKFSD